MQPGVSRCNPRSGLTLYNSQRDHTVVKVSTKFRGRIFTIFSFCEPNHQSIVEEDVFNTGQADC